MSTREMPGSECDGTAGTKALGTGQHDLRVRAYDAYPTGSSEADGKRHLRSQINTTPISREDVHD